jgi:hypothetical protein
MIAMPFCASANVRFTSESGLTDASMRARFILS